MTTYEHWQARSVDVKSKARPEAGAETAASGSVIRGADELLEKPREGKSAYSPTERRLIAGRARQILQRPVRTDELESADAVRSLVKEVAGQLEKVHQVPNFLPARFLRKGAECARAVCRIPFRTAEGRFVGTGFLVAPGVILTNNHVLESREVALNAVAEFDYELELPARRIAFLPDKLFYTHAQLDFTLVACDETTISDITPILLRRTPIDIMEGERVNIIQHPAGRPKEIVLHDNTVTRMTSELIYYRADTEGGSSGSPVFDNEWNLVGLHHWGRQEGANAENRAIRLPAIIAHLRGLGSNEARAVLDILSEVRGTDPLLGFFDIMSSHGDDLREVQVPGFSGTRDFVDIGFWNIEHFNDGISDGRIARVAEVVATLVMDTIGLVEVQEGALRRLVSELRNHGLEMDFRVQNEQGSQDVAVLFDTDTTKVKHRTDLLTRFDTLLSARIPEGTVFPRKPMFAECEVRSNDGGSLRRYLKIVVHLKAFTDDPPSRARRRAAAQSLRTIIDTLRSENNALPIVLGGDFNEFLTTDVLSGLTGSPDLVALTADDAVSGAASYVGGPMSLIDHIIISNDLRPGEIQGDDAAIVRLDRSVSDFADDVSDHVPIVFRVVFDGTGAGDSGGTPAHVLPIPAGATNVRVMFRGPGQ